MRKFKGTPPRLSQVFQCHDPPLYLITLCTLIRRPILACPVIHDAFRAYCTRGEEFNIAVGRYVIMTDHIHVFVRLGGEVGLSRWVKGLKRHLNPRLESLGHEATVVPGTRLKSFWQRGSFDHLLRNSESYAQKWHYVRENPVRADLVARAEDWPYQGELVVIDRA